MKCTKCGADIKKGNLYCSACGAEVQMVSAYNVMEEEFFLDFQHRAAEEESGGLHEEGEEQELPYEMPHALRKKNLLLGISVASLGFFILLFCSFYAVGDGGNAAEGERTGYERAIEALAQDDFVKANKAFSYAQEQQPDELSNYFWQEWLYGQQEDTERQKEVLKKILQLDKENIYACKDLIDVYLAEGDFEALHALMSTYEGSRLSALFADYRVETPAMELEPEPFRQGDVLTITAADGLNIYYTLDGTSPITDGTLYYAPIYLESGKYTVQAAACNEEGYYSPIVSEEIAVEVAYQLDMPTVTPNSGQFLTPQTIYVDVPEGCNAYYTWDRSDPTTASRQYSGGIAMPEGNNVLSVILVDEYGNTSSVQRVNYIYIP